MRTRPRHEDTGLPPPHTESPLPTDDQQFVTALARGLQVLQAFRSGEEWLGNQALSQRCQLPRSTVSRLTYTLTQLGFQHYDGREGRYRLGLATLKLGGTTLSRLDAVQVSRPLMQSLANATHSMVALGIRDGTSMLYIETCRPAAMGDGRLQLGSRVPMLASAMGRAYLAASDRATRHALTQRLQALDARQQAQSAVVLRQATEDLRSHGCCCSFGDWRPSINSLAVPLRLGHGLPLMVLSSAASERSIPRSHYLSDIGPQLLATAREIETRFQANPAGG